MRESKIVGITVLVAGLLSLGMIAGCSGGGDTDGGKAADEDFHGTQFVPDESNSGSIDLIVEEAEFNVSEIVGFRVRVVDRNGTAVPGLRLACDSEQGVAIIEPTTGHEITDEFGQISGKIGCAASGSYQFMCRLPVGGNFRDAVTIRCGGDTPIGFDGFEGAGGGGLGGGLQGDEDGGAGGTNTDGIRVVKLTPLDVNNEESPQIDTVQDICTPDDPTTTANELVVEPFTDGRIKFAIENNTNAIVRFTSLRYFVPDITASGTDFTSDRINFVSEIVVDANGGSAETTVLAFPVEAGFGSSGGDLFFYGRTTEIGQIGFRNVKVTFFGTGALGEDVQVSATTVMSFNNYNLCSSSS